MPVSQEITLTEIPNDEAHDDLIGSASRLLSREAYQGYSDPDTVRQRIESGRMLAAVDERHVLIGAGVLRTMGVKEASIYAVAVRSGQRNGGLGTDIMHGLEEMARQDGIETLYVTPSNDKVVGLYTRLGYEPVGESMTMQKDLRLSDD